MNATQIIAFQDFAEKKLAADASGDLLDRVTADHAMNHFLSLSLPPEQYAFSMKLLVDLNGKINR